MVKNKIIEQIVFPDDIWDEPGTSTNEPETNTPEQRPNQTTPPRRDETPPRRDDTPSPTPTPSKQSEPELCQGWHKKGCKSEAIKKVQNCLNIPSSGIFDEMLKNELEKYASTYAFREGFGDSDVEKICRFKNEEDKNRILQQQNQAELEKYRRQYPQQTTKATTIDEL